VLCLSNFRFLDWWLLLDKEEVMLEAQFSFWFELYFRLGFGLNFGFGKSLPTILSVTNFNELAFTLEIVNKYIL
jgi:hypothetical protein